MHMDVCTYHMCVYVHMCVCTYVHTYLCLISLRTFVYHVSVCIVNYGEFGETFIAICMKQVFTKPFLPMLKSPFQLP